MAKTIAAVMVEMLVQAGVRRIHGVVGDSLNGLVDEIRRSGKIEWIHYRHEESAAFAAGAEAQATGQLAVCAGSCGPGNLHLINGLYDCHRSMAPVLAIAAQIPSMEIGTGYFQETKPEYLFQQCSHYCETISSAKQMPRVFQIALQNALGKQGVAVITLSGDVSSETVDETHLIHPLFLPKPVIRPADEELQQIAQLINQADRITVLGGSGCAGAHAEVLQLCEHVKAPVVYALRGKEYLEYDNPYGVGLTGLIGFSSGAKAISRAEVLLMLGTDFPYKDWYPAHAKIIQVDIRPEHLGRRTRLDMGVVGSVGPTIQALLPMLLPKTDRSHLERSLEAYQESRKELDSHAKGDENDGVIRPEYLTAVLSEQAHPDAIFTCDVGTPTVWAARYLKMTRQRRLIGSFTHGSMASAMPQAIGAQLAFPDRQVIALAGDGGFSMLMGDLLTIYQYNLPVKLVIYNNYSLGFVAMEMKVAGIPPFGTDMKNPNFARMAEAMGIRGIRVENPADVPEAIDEALRHAGPVLVDVVVNPTELSMPPKIQFQQAWGFSMYMMKETLRGDLSDVVETIKTNFLK
ncbi:ubiquinone-dependent pyruvate dehydrogenase [Siphonobacter curvatus]|uniref:Ubiquinone-dependent pyruvate dehydrogenase n=1 Tax=Siphonobacter curvatus TaxID=2094562 RepID=A0A2S7IT50_9BACT|nr:ubiquinone-dependent pyruvate dehydrogenase [Siphonobacter curvatus]PQA60852.1 ubiquinone-dependent pyruvate dehydrogenase [Siphonobacter curvatus]